MQELQQVASWYRKHGVVHTRGTHLCAVELYAHDASRTTSNKFVQHSGEDMSYFYTQRCPHFSS